ncbi:targeting protein for Xklp2 homolog isoform X2 [Agrilus planipennis]|uniref:Targeting protein for Xklp2 homolog isoform X2 n=2 Tax=Agrilus planipennis TaxID=224129 RepID=A0A7F5RAT2_AGRPL|nr:targeting protein for Xklp2 homolog isoform X2 [Agrilus planipennis]
MSETNFAFSAPQYYDFASFTEEDVRDLEQYFEVDHESKQNHIDEFVLISSDDDIEEFCSVLVEDVAVEDTNSRNKLRKSFSTGNILTAWQSTKLGEEVHDSNTNNCQLNNLKGKKKIQNCLSSTSLFKEDRPLHRVTQSCVSQEWINKLAQPKYNSHNSRFVSMAEAVQRFQRETPTRYRSKLYSKPHSASITVDHNIPKPPTVPKSPALYTRNRIRSSTLPSREQRELMEFKEAQKNKIVSHPVNRKILRSPAAKVPVEIKPSTVPQPFHLTESNKKEPPKTDLEEFKFHANPVPKGLFNAIENPVIKKSSTTQPRTPALLKRYNALMQEKAEKEKKEMGNEPFKNMHVEGENKFNVESNEECSDKNAKKCTEVRPFSFEERDRLIQKKKDEALQKIMEEERKMREFHAKPVPKFIYEKKVRMSEALAPKQYLVNAEKSSQKLEQPAPQFKARPAKVLQMKPFEPQKPMKHLREIPSFELNTDRRAKERQMFEEKMKYRDELIKAQRQRSVSRWNKKKFDMRKKKSLIFEE